MFTRNLICVMAHGHPIAEATFHRHLPEWEKHCQDILVYCPADKPITAQIRHPKLLYGSASHHDDMANQRFKFLLSFLSGLDYESVTIHEYDSICLDNGIVPATTVGTLEIHGNWFNDSNVERWGSSTFIHPPLRIGNGALNELADLIEWNKLPEQKSEGFWDRLLGMYVEACAGLNRIECVPFCARGVSKNMIEKEDHESFAKAVRAGAVWIHGVKDKEAYDMLKKAYAEADL
jgi:hypothetical protein